MRILHINCNYLNSTLHQIMIEEMEKHGVINDVFVPTSDKRKSVIKPKENVCVSECFHKIDRLIFDYKQRKIIREISKQFDISKYDLIHAYTLFTDGNVARVLSQKYGIPYVVAIRNTDVNDFFKKRVLLRRRGLKNLLFAKKVFFLSQSYKDTVFQKYIPSYLKQTINSKVSVIPNGIDNYWFNNIFDRDVSLSLKRMEKKEITIIYAGGVDYNKNLLLTSKALNILRKRGWKVEFIVAGRIKNKRVFRAIKKDITYYSPLPKERLIELYRKADAFVMPSRHESFGLVYAEAMSQGLPVVYSRGQGFDKQFQSGYIGYECGTNSATELASKILLICDNYRKLSENCLVGCKKFSWDRIVNEYLRIYEDIKNEQ